jgi:hypothetical protein
MGVLHAGPASALGGLSSAKIHGLKNWERADVTVLVPAEADIPAVEGVDFVRTRRDLEAMKLPGTRAPVCRLEPAVLLFGAYTGSQRTGCGVLAAVVQQRLTTPDALLQWIELDAALRRARLFPRHSP